MFSEQRRANMAMGFVGSGVSWTCGQREGFSGEALTCRRERSCRRVQGNKRSKRHGRGSNPLRMTAAVPSSEGEDASKRSGAMAAGGVEGVEKVVREHMDPALDAKYRKWRLRTFYSIFLGYATFYLTRNSFTYTAPGMRVALGLTLGQLGVITSVFPLFYGFSKLLSGILADRVSTRTFLAIGLAMTGVINIAFGMQTSLLPMIALWSLNGIFQGFGAPPCAKLLTQWYSKSERGTWWGFWNTSHNIGGFLIPLLAGYCVRAFGWQYGMIVPGSIAIVMGLFMFDRIRNGPSEVGLPPVDIYRDDVQPHHEPKMKDGKKDFWYELKTNVLSNRNVWLLAFSYFFVYFVRQGVSSWAHIFLLDYKMVGNAQEAAFRVSGMEIGGLLGSLTSGWASDRMMRGRRIPVIVLWLLGVMASLVAFYFVPGPMRYLSWLSVFCIGFFIYGPQMLVGLAGAEIVDSSAVSSTIGLLGWIAYLGASIAGFPLTVIVTKFGWGAYVLALLAFSSISVLLLLPMWRLGVPAELVKPVPEVVPIVPEAVPVQEGVPVFAVTDNFQECKSCAATGKVMRLECGPSTPTMLSCKYIETPCPFCGGHGYKVAAAA